MGYFYLLAILSNATRSTCVRNLIWIYIFSFGGLRMILGFGFESLDVVKTSLGNTIVFCMLYF